MALRLKDSNAQVQALQEQAKEAYNAHILRKAYGYN
jgi:hypothetical protein